MIQLFPHRGSKFGKQSSLCHKYFHSKARWSRNAVHCPVSSQHNVCPAVVESGIMHHMLPVNTEFFIKHSVYWSTYVHLQMPPKGAIAPYDPENFDESFAPEYGGYTFSDNAGGGGRGGRGGGGGGPRFVTCFICTYLIDIAVIRFNKYTYKQVCCVVSLFCCYIIKWPLILSFAFHSFRHCNSSWYWLWDLSSLNA